MQVRVKSFQCFAASYLGLTAGRFAKRSAQSLVSALASLAWASGFSWSVSLPGPYCRGLADSVKRRKFKLHHYRIRGSGLLSIFVPLTPAE
jgi:hypothetical protein